MPVVCVGVLREQTNLRSFSGQANVNTRTFIARSHIEIVSSRTTGPFVEESSNTTYLRKLCKKTERKKKPSRRVATQHILENLYKKTERKKK